MILATLLVAAVTFDDSTDVPALRRQLEALDAELLTLYSMRDRLETGSPVTLDDVRIPGSRFKALRGLDAKGALKLGLGPATLRSRLLPAFELSIQQFAASPVDARHDPVLERLVELEKELLAAASYQLERRGLQHPLDAGPLADAAMDPQASTPMPEKPHSAPPDQLRLEASMAYASGDWEAALTAYEALDDELTETNVEHFYRRADCLMKLDRAGEAFDFFTEIADLSPDTTWGKNAKWNATVAEAIALFDVDGNDGP